MGALKFQPALDPKYVLSEKMNVDRLAQLASNILAQRESISLDAGANAMRQILQVGTSAGGARAKAVIAWNEKQTRSAPGRSMRKADSAIGSLSSTGSAETETAT